MSPAAIEKVLSAYFGAANRLDMNAWLATMDEKIESRDPAATLPMKGHAALSAFFQGMGNTMKKVSVAPEKVFIYGNSAAVYFRGKAVAKNGKSAAFEGVKVLTLNGKGKIRAIKSYWDPLALMTSLQ